MKKLLLAIPDYMYEEIQKLQPYVAFTITGTIIQMLDHGINYELKKKKKYIEKKQQPQESAQEVTADQQNITISPEDDKAIKKTLEIAKIRWVD